MLLTVAQVTKSFRGLMAVRAMSLSVAPTRPGRSRSARPAAPGRRQCAARRPRLRADLDGPQAPGARTRSGDSPLAAAARRVAGWAESRRAAERARPAAPPARRGA